VVRPREKSPSQQATAIKACFIGKLAHFSALSGIGTAFANEELRPDSVGESGTPRKHKGAE